MTRVPLMLAMLLALPGTFARPSTAAPSARLPLRSDTTYRPGDPLIQAPSLRFSQPDKRHGKLDGRLRDLLRPGSPASADYSLHPRTDGKVRVYVYCSTWTSADRTALEGLGFEVELVCTKPWVVVQGWVPPTAASDLEALAFVKQVTEPAYAFQWAGAFTAQSDAVLRCDQARSELGIDGSGVRVGVLADSVDARAMAQSTGDLPPDDAIYIGKVGTGRNEGTAMLEVVHDLAPGAPLGFYGPETSLDMIAGIQDLTAHGCRVLCDDLAFPDQPCFEPGSIDLAIADAAMAGVTYVTAAGNMGQSTVALNGGSRTRAQLGGIPLDLVVCGPLIPDVPSYAIPVMVPAGGDATVILQWDSPWGGAADDYDLYLTSLDGSVVYAVSEGTQDGTQMPAERAFVHNDSLQDAWGAVVVSAYHASARRLRVYVFGGIVDSHYVASADSIGFNNKASSALTVGATFASAAGTTGGGDGRLIAPYSSRGPSGGKPDVTGADGVSVTGAGGFPTTFTGTSAAAAGVAAVCALTLSALPGQTPDLVKEAVRTTAADCGEPGWDGAFGWGLADAMSAASLVRATTLRFGRQPGWGVPDVPFAMQPVVRAERYDGSLDTSFTGTVSLSVAAGPAGAALSGPTVVKASRGIAAFAGVRAAPAGPGYVLTASAFMLPPAHTAPFSVGTGSVAAWGSSASAQTGDAMKPAWAPEPSALTGAKQVSAGAFHTLAVKRDGTVWAWGLNLMGACGAEFSDDRLVPTAVKGLTGVETVSAGMYHSLALKSDGTVWAWGGNFYGQLGCGSTQGSLWTPIQATGLTDVVSVSAGSTHSLAATRIGKVWSWGLNSYGQLGDGTLTASNVPVAVPNLSGVASVSAGEDHSLAVTGGGAVWAWGQGTSGQLGDGASVDRAIPVQVAGLANVAAVSAGSHFSLALKRDGTVWAWGNNWYGQMGDGTQAAHPTPKVVAGLSDIVAVSAGASYCLALQRDGTLWGWGYNMWGSIGDGTSVYCRWVPVRVSGFAAAQISAGGRHSLAVLADGSVWSWGGNDHGQAGNGTSAYRPSAVPVKGLEGVVSACGGGSHSLALTADGTAYAWGGNLVGQLGLASGESRCEPVRVDCPAGTVALSASVLGSMALTQNGSVWVWGFNAWNDVDDGSLWARDSPTEVTGLGAAVAVSGGYEHSIALATDGTVWAWGSNRYGQCGDGSASFRNIPVRVSGLVGVVAIAAGEDFCLAARRDGTVWAWGRNDAGQLGDGTTVNRPVPVQVVGLRGIVAVAAATEHSLALAGDGSLWAWGANRGALGDGTTENRSRPVAVQNLTDVVAISAGPDVSMALKRDGTIWSWGQDNRMVLAASAGWRPVPALVRGLSGGLSVDGGDEHSLAVTTGPMAASVAFRTQPVPGRALVLATQPVAEIRAADGSVMTTSDAQVTLFEKPGSGPSGSWLAGPSSVVCRDGLAPFWSLGVSQPGSGYVLRAVVPGLPPVDSEPFAAGTGPFTWQDMLRALSICAGGTTSEAGDIAGLSLALPLDTLDLADVAAIARVASGRPPIKQ